MIDKPKEGPPNHYQTLVFFLFCFAMVTWILFDPKPQTLFMDCREAKLAKRTVGSRKIQEVKGYICVWGL